MSDECRLVDPGAIDGSPTEVVGATADQLLALADGLPAIAEASRKQIRNLQLGKVIRKNSRAKRELERDELEEVAAEMRRWDAECDEVFQRLLKASLLYAKSARSAAALADVTAA